MKIRSATKKDFPVIAALHIRSWQNAYAGILPESFLGAPLEREFTRYWRHVDMRIEDVVLVAEKDGLCGFIAAWCRPNPYIDNLHIKPSLRSKSIGTALLKSAVEELLARGHKTAFLWVFENNHKAARFYKRMGGIITEKAPQNIFGYSIPSLKIEWDDLAAIPACLQDTHLRGSRNGSD